jgi:hypothetical protein
VSIVDARPGAGKRTSGRNRVKKPFGEGLLEPVLEPLPRDERRAGGALIDPDERAGFPRRIDLTDPFGDQARIPQPSYSRFNPSPTDRAFADGYFLGRHRTPAAPPLDLSQAEFDAWTAGFTGGQLDAQDEDLEYEFLAGLQQESAFGDPTAEIPECELVRGRR